MMAETPPVRVYFQAHGRSLRAVRDYQRASADMHKTRLAMMEEIGAKDLVTRGDSVVGAQFSARKSVDPTVWRASKNVLVDGEVVYVPDRRYSGGKDMSRRLRLLRNVAFSVPGVEPIVSGFRFYTPGFTDFGRSVVILKLRAGMGTPLDAERIKPSRYARLKERRAEREAREAKSRKRKETA